MKKILVDYHIHSSISPDASFSMEEMCRAAIEKGLKEIAITDHFEFYTKDYKGYAFDQAYIESYFNTLEKCRKKFDEKIIIRSGAEFGQQHINIERSKEVLRSFKFDFVIGSLHKIHNIDVKNMEYSEGNKRKRSKEYLENLYYLVDRGDFDCLGHLDLVKRYAARYQIKIDLMEHKIEVQQILQRLIERNKGIEINTSGLRQEVKETFPSFEIVKMYRSLGGEILTIGSDAHSPKDIAADFVLISDFILNAGFTTICTFNNRECSFKNI